MHRRNRFYGRLSVVLLLAVTVLTARVAALSLRQNTPAGADLRAEASIDAVSEASHGQHTVLLSIQHAANSAASNSDPDPTPTPFDSSVAPDLNYDPTTHFAPDLNYVTIAERTAAEAAALERQLERMRAEYPVAATVYAYLRDCGWSDPVIAGVLGNMATECGGQTLALLPNTIDSENLYYGVCQWSMYYNPAVVGLDLLGQLDYLLSNIEQNMRYFGGDYAKFLAIDDAASAARYFCRYYEVAEGADRRATNAKMAMRWIEETATAG